MKHSGFAWIAAISLSVLAALPFSAAAQDSNPVFDKTTARLEKGGQYPFSTPRDAFAALIDKVGKRGTWDSNPLVFAYECIRED